MKKNNIIEIYMCKTDYQYHIPDDMHGVNIYFSEESIKKNRKCVESCGIVKLKLDLDTMEPVNYEKK